MSERSRMWNGVRAVRHLRRLVWRGLACENAGHRTGGNPHMRTGAINRLVVAAALVAVPDCAAAHSPIAGIGAFYNGMLHPLLVPAHLLAILAVGLLVGQNAPAASRGGWIAFVAALACGLAVVAVAPPAVPQAAILAVACACGLAVAVARSAPVLLVALPVAAGLAVGLDSFPDGIAPREIGLALAGVGLGAALAATYVGGLAAWLSRPWQRIGLRVAGSWIAASALLVLALELAPGKAGA